MINSEAMKCPKHWKIMANAKVPRKCTICFDKNKKDKERIFPGWKRELYSPPDDPLLLRLCVKPVRPVILNKFILKAIFFGHVR